MKRKRSTKKQDRFARTHKIISVHASFADLKLLDQHVRIRARGKKPHASRSQLLLHCFKRIVSRH